MLFDRKYWTSLINFDTMVREGMIEREDLKLFSYAENAEEIWTNLIKAGLAMHSVRHPG